MAQHAAFRVKGRVVNERGEPMREGRRAAGSVLRLRRRNVRRTAASSPTQTNREGRWSVGALQPGIWLFEVIARGYVPETRRAADPHPDDGQHGHVGMALTVGSHPEAGAARRTMCTGELLTQARLRRATGRRTSCARRCSVIPEDPHADLPGGRRSDRDGGARHERWRSTLFMRALERDPVVVPRGARHGVDVPAASAISTAPRARSTRPQPHARQGRAEIPLSSRSAISRRSKSDPAP